MISSLVPALISAFKARRELALENALRQQLAVLRRSVKRPRLSKVDRVFWVLLRVLALFTVGDVYASLCKRGAYAPFTAQRRSRALFWL